MNPAPATGFQERVGRQICQHSGTTTDRLLLLVLLPPLYFSGGEKRWRGKGNLVLVLVLLLFLHTPSFPEKRSPSSILFLPRRSPLSSSTSSFLFLVRSLPLHRISRKKNPFRDGETFKKCCHGRLHRWPSSSSAGKKPRPTDRPTALLSVVSSFVGASQRQTENGEGKRRRMEKVCGAKRVERGRGKRKRRRRISRCGEEGRGRKGGRKYVSAHNFVSDLTCSCMTCQVLVVATRGGVIY